MLVRAPISMVVPVGPRERHWAHLSELVSSIEHQTMLPSEVIFVDDGSGLVDSSPRLNPPMICNCPTRIVRNRWNLGVPASMNVGIGSSSYDLMIMGCADDQFLPRCVELCWEAWLRERYQLGYYYLGVRYSSGEEQNCACGAAMVTRELWRQTGGFPPQCAVGAADHIFLHGMLIADREGALPVHQIRVSDELTYWYRHDSNEATSNNIWPAIEAVKEWYGGVWTMRGRGESHGLS